MRELFLVVCAVVSISAFISLSFFVALTSFSKGKAWLCTFLGIGFSEAGYASRASFKVSAFLVLAAGAYLLCIYEGYLTLLWWMPSSWGTHNDDGEWTSVRVLIAGVAVVPVGFGFINLILNALSNWRDIQFLRLEYGIADLERKALVKLFDARASKNFLEFYRADFHRELEKHSACALADQNAWPGISDCPGLREHQRRLIIGAYERLVLAADEHLNIYK